MKDFSRKGYNWYNLEPNFRMYLSAVKKIKAISIRNYLSDLRYFTGWFDSQIFGDLEGAELEQLLTAEKLTLFRQYLIDSKLPQRSINRRLSSIRAFFDFLLSQSLIKSNPSKSLRNYYETHREHSLIRYDQFVIQLERQGKDDEEITSVSNDVHEFIDIAGIKEIYENNI